MCQIICAFFFLRHETANNVTHGIRPVALWQAMVHVPEKVMPDNLQYS